MQCDGCTLCCKLLPVPWMQSPAGELCRECDGSGCRIFDSADKRCRSFACMYRQTVCNEEIRPDKCGVIFEKLSDTLIFGSVDPEIGFTDAAQRQVAGFQDQGFGVVLDLMGERRLVVARPVGGTSADTMKEFLLRRELLRERGRA